MARVTTRSDTRSSRRKAFSARFSPFFFGFRGDASDATPAKDDATRASASSATASGSTAVTSNPHASTTSLSASASTEPGSYVTEADFDSRDTETARTPAVPSSADVTADVQDPHTMPSMARRAPAEAIARIASASRGRTARGTREGI